MRYRLVPVLVLLAGCGSEPGVPTWLQGEIACGTGRCGTGQVCMTTGVEECYAKPSDAGTCPEGCVYDHGCRRRTTSCLTVASACYAVCSGENQASCDTRKCIECISPSANVGGCRSREIGYLPY